jgi:cytoskeletal protein CcmA (bactofilin family)
MAFIRHCHDANYFPGLDLVGVTTQLFNGTEQFAKSIGVHRHVTGTLHPHSDVAVTVGVRGVVEAGCQEQQ